MRAVQPLLIAYLGTEKTVRWIGQSDQTLAVSSETALPDAPSAEKEREDKENQEDDEQELRNPHRCRNDSRKTENSGNQSDDQKRHGPS